jgi:hypothetical protein
VIPAVASLNDSDRLWGRAVFEFVAAEFGSRGVRQYLAALRNASPAAADVSHAALGVAASEFDGAFRAYVRVRFVER